MPVNQTEDDFISNEASNKSTMRWTIVYVKDRHFAKVIAKGIYNIDDHMRMLKDVVTRDFWQPGMNLLINALELDFSDTRLEQLRAVSLKRIELDALIGNGKTAIVMSSITDFARGRQYELIMSGKVAAKIDVFKNEDKALEWLLG